MRIDACMGMSRCLAQSALLLYIFFYGTAVDTLPSENCSRTAHARRVQEHHMQGIAQTSREDASNVRSVRHFVLLVVWTRFRRFIRCNKSTCSVG